MKQTIQTLYLATNLKIIFAQVLFMSSAQGQADLVDLFVNSDRPIAVVSKTLISEYPVVITYEDPRLEYRGDIQNLTHTRQDIDRYPSTEVPKVLFPSTEIFNATYHVSTATGEPEDWAATLRQLISDYEVGGKGGRFQVQQTGDVFHIIPTHVRNGSGLWIDSPSILDIPISLPVLEGEGIELVVPVTEAIAKATGISVGVGNMPADLFFRHRGRIEAVNGEPARDVLLRVLHSINDRLTWRLYYGPGTKRYSLNIFLVNASRAASPERNVRLPLERTETERTPAQVGR